MTEFVPVDDDLILPEPQPPCMIGVGGHTWKLTIEEGRIGLTSDCESCDESVFGAMGTEIVEMAEITGRLDFCHDHLGKPHGFGVCDCNYWWQFVPDADARSRPQP